MPVQYPVALDDLANPTPTDPLASSSVPHSQQHRDLNDIIEALQAKLGIGAGTALESSVLRGTGPGVSGWEKVQASDLAPGAVTGGVLAPNSVSGAASGASGHILPETITGANILDGSIGSAELADGAVGAAQIAPESITATQLAPGAVGASELGTDAVAAQHIQAGAVGASEIADASVGTTELADEAVTYAKIGVGQVGTIHLGDQVVNSAKILDRTIVSTDIAVGGVTTTEIADRTIIATDIGVNQVGTNELAAQAVSYGAQSSSGQPLSVANTTSWVFDNANLVITQEMYAGGFVRAIFQGHFQSSVAGAVAAFGIVRVGIDAAPIHPILVSFPLANVPVPVVVHYQGFVSLGTYQFTLGMQCQTNNFTLSWTAFVNRFLSSLGFWR